ncbi:MAG: patatin-like phospholipase family protein [Woeseiaceae bacterium]
MKDRAKTGPEIRAPRKSGWNALLALASAALFAQGCTVLNDRNPLPEDYKNQASVLGTSDYRFWGDELSTIGDTLPENPTMEQLQAALPGLVRQELNILAISGGGENGAFAAGLLNGWTEAGTRPEFNIVTGVSTGALIAPFAFLGPAYDHFLEQIYTQYSTKDLIKQRGRIRSLRTDAIFDTKGLRSLIAEFADEELMAAIAEEHRRGRYLLIGTTNLDAARPTTWNIGAIASSGKPGALQLIRDVLLASASIPIVFPPVIIEVEANGQTYDELHTDGGVSRQSFLFDLSADENSFEGLQIIGTGRAFLIMNSKLEPAWETVDRRIFDIAGRSASSMVRSQGLGDLYREFLAARKFGIDFNLAYIPSEFEADNHELFDQNYMRSLYKLGYEMGVEGYSWRNAPPGIELP